MTTTQRRLRNDRMLSILREVTAEERLTKNQVDVGNKIMNRIYRTELWCERCGNEDIDHGAVWEDNTGSNRIVCEDCHRNLKKKFHIKITPGQEEFPKKITQNNEGRIEDGRK